MAKPPTPRDAVSVVIPVHNASERLVKVIPAWSDMLGKLGRGYEILVVDDGSTDGTAKGLEHLAARVPHLKVLHHEKERGFGACLRTALADAQHPLFFYTSCDGEYSPGNIRQLLERIEVRDELFGKQPDLVNGCRTGRPRPAVLVWCGRLWRLFIRVAFGIPLSPPPTWLGPREYLYSGLVGFLFGVPLADVNSPFKLYRTKFLKRVPIQSDGDFVHVELVAKATFLTCLMDERPLTPMKTSDTAAPSRWREMWRVFQHPDFGIPDGPDGGVGRLSATN